MDETIWGRNAVWEALRAGRPVNKILIARGTHGKTREIMDRAREVRVPVQLVDREALDRLADGAGHQGIFAYLSPKGYVTLDELLEQVQGQQQDPLLLVLAGWEDPRNFGAIVRSAEAAGVQGVIIPERRAVPLTGVVAKASAGALEHLPISRVGNLSRTLEQLEGDGVLGRRRRGRRGESLLRGRPDRPPGPGDRRRGQGARPPGADLRSPGAHSHDRPYRFSECGGGRLHSAL